MHAGKPGKWEPFYSGGRAQSDGGSAEELVSALERLAMLRVSGALSEGEFERAKDAVITRCAMEG